MASTNILNSYIPKFLVDLKRKNEDVITVTTNYFSSNLDSYVLDTRTINPVVIQTTQSIAELRPEVSNVYPYRYPTTIEYDGSTLLISPTATSQPTASQDYYVPIYFERYDASVLTNIDKNFTELIVEVVE